MCPIWNIPTIIVACKLAAIHGADVPLYEQGNIDAGDIRYLWFLGGLLRARLFPQYSTETQVPDCGARDWFCSDCVGGWQFGPFRLHQQHLKLYGAKDARNSSAI
jgi:hypothetical protein